MLPNKKDNTYNADKTFDYFTIKAMLIQSLESIVRTELNRYIASINLHKIHIQKEDVTSCLSSILLRFCRGLWHSLTTIPVTSLAIFTILSAYHLFRRPSFSRYNGCSIVPPGINFNEVTGCFL
jgi:hypothetical protein